MYSLPVDETQTAGVSQTLRIPLPVLWMEQVHRGGGKLRMVQVQNRPQNVWVPRILHLSVTGCDPEDLEVDLPNDG